MSAFVVLASGFAEDTDAIHIRADARARVTLNDVSLEARDGAAIRGERALPFEGIPA